MEQIIEEYFAYLAIERGSSPLTIDAYAKDLATYRTFLEERGKTDLAHIERDDILAFQKEPARSRLCCLDSRTQAFSDKGIASLRPTRRIRGARPGSKRSRSQEARPAFPMCFRSIR